MKNNLSFVVPVVTLLSGCVMWDAGYTENKPVTRYAVPQSDKVPITFSVNMQADRSDVFALPTAQDLRERLEAELRSTGVFSDVKYGTKGGSDSYHVEFDFKQAGMTPEQSMAVGLLSGYTLLLIPTCEVLSFDGTAVLSLQDKPIYSTAKAEKLCCLIWLPMAPVGLFMNSWSIWFFTERGTVRALVEDVVAEHNRRFLKNSDVSVISQD